MGHFVWGGILIVIWIVVLSNLTDIMKHQTYGIFLFPIVVTVPTLLWWCRPLFREAAENNRLIARQRADEEEERKRRDEEDRVFQEQQAAREHVRATMPAVPSMTANVRVNRNAVHVMIALSETERAAVEQYGLSSFVLESRPEWSPDDIENIIDSMETKLRAQGFHVDSSTLREDRRKLASQRINTTLGDFLDPLFQKQFDEPGEAMRYADKLRKEILPQIKQIIYRSIEHADKGETFQV